MKVKNHSRVSVVNIDMKLTQPYNNKGYQTANSTQQGDCDKVLKKLLLFHLESGIGEQQNQ